MRTICKKPLALLLVIAILLSMYLPVHAIEDAVPDISIGDLDVNEAAGFATFTITLSQPYAGMITLDYSTEDNTAAATDSMDYMPVSGTKTIIPGETTVTVTILINDDSLDEEDENFYLNLSNPSIGTITKARGICTIFDNDNAPGLSINDVTVTEGNAGTTNAVFNVVLSAPSGREVNVNYATANNTAVAESDYVAISGSLTFTAGQTSKTITVQVLGDTLAEGNETFFVNLSGASNASFADIQGIGTIETDEAFPTISIDNHSRTEGENLSFTVTLSPHSGETVTVDYATADGTAVAGTDYTAVSGSLTFSSGETSKNVTVEVLNDTTDESNETIYVNLTNATNANMIDSQGVGTIEDDDAAPGLSISDATVTEGNAGTTNAVFNVILSEASGKTISVSYSTANATAIAGSDYGPASGSLTFFPGETSKSTVVLIYGDTLDEGDETFEVNLTGASNAVITDGFGGGTIRDDDDPPAISISDAAVNEGDPGMVNLIFTVTLSAMSGKTIIVDYITADGTATAGSDYVSASGSLTFAPGQTSKIVTIAVDGDYTHEADETVTLELSNAINASIADNQGGGTIRNDDGPVIKALGNAIEIYNGDNTPSSTDFTDFGNASVSGGTVEHVFTISNTGADELNLTGSVIAISGSNASDFTITSMPAISISPGDTTSFKVTFAPAAAGVKNALVSITSNDINASPYTFSISGNGTTPPPPPPPQPDSTPTPAPAPGVDLIVNGEVYQAATSETTQKGGKKVTTVMVQDAKVVDRVNREMAHSIVVIPVNDKSDVIVGEINGQTIKVMESKSAVLEIRTVNATYTLPASQIDIDAVAAKIGDEVELKDIKVSVTIAASPEDAVRMVENTAQGNRYTLVVKPVDFFITCTSSDKTVEVSRFNGYVERTIAIPDHVKPSEITTGIVLNSDGTFSHVPTTVFEVNGKWYAKIKSLTNSTYSVIWNPISFEDVRGHWGEKDVNDMSSRLVMEGIDEDHFNPEAAITRGEYTATIIKALGVMRTGAGHDMFTDVDSSHPYYDAISIAYAYGIVVGNGNIFSPDESITREQAMRIIYQAMIVAGHDTKITSLEVKTILMDFNDGDQISSWARYDAAACIEDGIFAGYGNKKIMPQAKITRVQTAAIVRRMLLKAKLISAS